MCSSHFAHLNEDQTVLVSHHFREMRAWTRGRQPSRILIQVITPEVYRFKDRALFGPRTCDTFATVSDRCVDAIDCSPTARTLVLDLNM